MRDQNTWLQDIDLEYKFIVQDGKRLRFGL